MKVESIAEQLFFVTVRVDTVGKDGTPCAGTAFLFSHKVGNRNFPFVVTNKHVVEGMREGSLTFLQAQGSQPQFGKGFRLLIEDWSKVWFGHPSQDVDISICPLAPLEAHAREQHKVELFYRVVNSEMILNDEQINALDALESVTFIGYPNGVWDHVNLLPVVRQGTTASPLSIDFGNTPCFLIDASVFGGSSGSPVFLLNQGMYADKMGNPMAGTRCFFLGVVTAVFQRTDLREIVRVPIPTQVKPMAIQHEMIDLGIVFKARTVVETVEAYIKQKS